jgi:hypothetical protein
VRRKTQVGARSRRQAPSRRNRCATSRPLRPGPHSPTWARGRRRGDRDPLGHFRRNMPSVSGSLRPCIPAPPRRAKRPRQGTAGPVGAYFGGQNPAGLLRAYSLGDRGHNAFSGQAYRRGRAGVPPLALTSFRTQLDCIVTTLLGRTSGFDRQTTLARGFPCLLSQAAELVARIEGK